MFYGEGGDTGAPGDRPFVDADSGEASLRGAKGLGQNQDRPRATPTLPQAALPPSAAPAAPSAPPTNAPSTPTAPLSDAGAATGQQSGLPQIDDWTYQQWQRIAQTPGMPDYIQRLAAVAMKARGGNG